MPPAGQAPFEKGARHLLKLLIIKALGSPETRPSVMVLEKASGRQRQYLESILFKLNFNRFKCIQYLANVIAFLEVSARVKTSFESISDYVF